MTLILGIIAIFEAVAIVYLLVRKTTSTSGVIRVLNAPNGMTFSLELDGDPAELEKYDQVIFKVVADGLNNRGVNTD